MVGPQGSRPEWLTVRDVAGLLHVGEETVRRWVRKERVRAKFFGGRTGYRIGRADLEVFLSSRVPGQRTGTRKELVTASQDCEGPEPQ